MNLRLPPLRLLAVCIVLLVVGPPAAAQAAQPGINVAGNDPRRIAAALATDAKLVRFFVEWKTLQPSRGEDYPSRDPGARNLAREIDDAIAQVNRAGAKPMFAILGAPKWANGSDDQLVPPTDPQDYADFFAQFVRHTRAGGRQVAAYEVWNEQDAEAFWHAPSPEQAGAYSRLLKATYQTAKPFAGDAAILVGGLTGNNADYLQQLYDTGARGSFDGVAVHTDTACLSLGPDFFYREDPGSRVGRYTFLGYRSVRSVMAANQDLKPIWMTEMGWSSTGGGPTSCTRGTGAGVRADGVSEPVQALLLLQAYGCLAHDPYVVAGVWFTMFDDPQQTPAELGRYGLVRADGLPKLAYAGFRAVTGTGGGAPGPCGDFEPPTVSILSPAPDFGYTERFIIRAMAKDNAPAGVAPSGLRRLTFKIDGRAQAIGNFSVGDGVAAEQDYFGAKDLADGEHTVTVLATDANGNVSSESIKVYKGAKYAGRKTYKPKFVFPRGKNPTCRARKCSFKGRLTGPPGISVSGRVRVQWQFFSRQRVRSAIPGRKRYVSRWVTFHKGGSSARRSFTFRQQLARKGRWRVRAYYDGALPLLKATTVFKTLSV